MAGTAQVEGVAGLIDEFSKCWGYLDHIEKVAKNASYLMEGTNEGLNIEGMDTVEFLAGNSNEKSKVDFIATWVEKIMIDYTRAQKTKMAVRCNFYNRGFCSKGRTCDFEHPAKLCEQYTQEGVCSRRHCKDRHLYKCKYFWSEQGCFRGNSCEFLHANDVVTNLEEEHDKMDDEEGVEDDITNEQKEETVEGTNADKKEDDNEEVNKYREVFGDESDGFLVLEKAITDGIELDDYLLDKILEGMEKSDKSNNTDGIELDDEHLDQILEGMEKSDKSKDEKKAKKKKVKKANGKDFKKTLAN